MPFEPTRGTMTPDVILSPRDIVAFSDVAGRLDLLESALDLADLPGHPDRVVAAFGDYVDRGDETAARPETSN
jgi:hypothetical protein